MQEIWKDIRGYEGLYQVSNFGNVRSLRTNKNLYYSKAGKYYRVGLFNGQRKTFAIHRLVAEAFIPNLENKPCVNHIDCNTFNNNVSNLEWCTYKENNNHAHHIIKSKVASLEILINKNYESNKMLNDKIKEIKIIVNNLK